MVKPKKLVRKDVLIQKKVIQKKVILKIMKKTIN